MTSPHVVAARLPDGRLLIAILDPIVPNQHSPLRRHLRAETTTRQGLKGLNFTPAGTLSAQATGPREEPGEEQPGQTAVRTPR